jgi:hypothetical protein
MLAPNTERGWIEVVHVAGEEVDWAADVEGGGEGTSRGMSLDEERSTSVHGLTRVGKIEDIGKVCDRVSTSVRMLERRVYIPCHIGIGWSLLLTMACKDLPMWCCKFQPAGKRVALAWLNKSLAGTLCSRSSGDTYRYHCNVKSSLTKMLKSSTASLAQSPSG